ncbi:cis-3-hydroxy-L-proline dehydratase [Halobacterium sp. KA-6]|uniref:cis-3-hydroxy-L-proline dehydratase n=1 Tax=Halobacterium sp. KA-6 TaxID=2896368 RepID=UPI001E36FEB6|nr:cis-3-hydroxy-L-proline dehydratase [Halobacterium sp. KA-6]MCD2204595.1 mandelate racemase/muconate lactonizing enzyme family protein [Halobacterium sp. KA-6]
MEITSIKVYQVDLPIAEGSYDWSNGNSYESFDSTIVRLETDTGLAGWGEVATLGSAYLPAYARGARAAIEELAPAVLGADPTQPAVLAERLDRQLRGHPYAKSVLDVACWDLAGKAAGVPVSTLLGGQFGEDVPLYRAISQDTPEAMAKSVANYHDAGYENFQLKIGEDPVTDAERIRASRAELDDECILDADANTGLTRHEAVRLVEAIDDIDVYVEQPCQSYEACRAIRRKTDHPFVLDEVMTGIDAVVRGYQDDAMDVVNLKIAKVGGLTRARTIRDLCAQFELSMIIEDTWGSEIATAAIAHLAQSTPADYRLASTDFQSYNTVTTADGAPERADGRMRASTAPGLGVEPRLDVLGEPLATYGGKA